MRAIVLLIWLIPAALTAQFAPAAGKPGSTALRHDSSCFISWASACTVYRGLMDISEPDSGLATAGNTASAVGPAMQNGIVSLGDMGVAVLRFPHPVSNGPGWDFAVFENSFLDTFLEFAFVEVSTDSIRWVRFASESLTDTAGQVSSFGYTRPENIHNLAGKYRAGFGTPFDLEELKDSAGLDIQLIRFVRISDVVGSMLPQYATRDSKGRKINDPWPTRFPSSGFDLDAVGVIHQNVSAGINSAGREVIKLLGNPVSNGVLHIHAPFPISLSLLDAQGRSLMEFRVQTGQQYVETRLSPGCYVLSAPDLHQTQWVVFQ